MSLGIGWVAGSVRGRLLANRRIGTLNSRNVASSASLPDALGRLEDGPYGHDVHRGMTLSEAQRGIGATSLWHVRVLAGWLPPSGGDQLRALAGWWEILNIEDHLASMAGHERPEPYNLGSLATTWPRVREANTPAEIREVLDASPWGDPGGDRPERISVGLNLAWAQRVAEEVDQAATWANGWSALVVARDLFLGERLLVTGEAPRTGGLGWEWPTAATLRDLAAKIPRSASWVLEGVEEGEDLWQAEARWWRRVDNDASKAVRGSRPGPAIGVGVFGLLVVDAWRTQAALEMAARGGGPLEVFDAVA